MAQINISWDNQYNCMGLEQFFPSLRRYQKNKISRKKTKKRMLFLCSTKCGMFYVPNRGFIVNKPRLGLSSNFSVGVYGKRVIHENLRQNCFHYWSSLQQYLFLSVDVQQFFFYCFSIGFNNDFGKYVVNLICTLSDNPSLLFRHEKLRLDIY